MHAPLQLALMCSVVACGPDEERSGGASDTSSPGKPAAPAAGAPGAPAAAAAKGEEEVGKRTFKDTDFVESEFNRDPFRSFMLGPKVKGDAITSTRVVLMPNTPVNAIKLIAIITGISQPRAMIIDEKGVGYVATRGDFVGRAEVVQTGGTENLPIALNWRVDRIRENEIILAREAPSAPNRPPLTRVIALHEAKEDLPTVSMSSEDT